MALKFFIRLLGFLVFVFVALQAGCSRGNVSWSSEDKKALSLWVDERRSGPGRLVGEALKGGRSLVLSQENAMRADTVDLVKTLVPVFLDHGLKNMALFFVNDSGEFRLNPSLAYSDYNDFLSYLEEIKKEFTPEDSPLTWRGLRGRKQISMTALKSTLLNTMGNNSVFIWLSQADMDIYFRLVEDLKQEQSEFVPPLLITHHGPEDAQWEGLFEATLSGLDSRRKTFAFHSDSPAFPGFHIRSGLKGEVIHIITSSPYREVMPLKRFVSSQNSEIAITYFQNLSIRNPKWWSNWLMNQLLKRQARKYGNFISRNQKKWIS